jgi:hypothetical protein
MPLVQKKIHHISNVIQGIGTNAFFGAKIYKNVKNKIIFFVIIFSYFIFKNQFFFEKKHLFEIYIVRFGL